MMTTDEIDAEIERIEEEFYTEVERVNRRLEELRYENRVRVKFIPADQFMRELCMEVERGYANLAELRRKRLHIVPFRRPS